MQLKLSNNAIGTLVSSMTADGTSVVLAPGQGAKFPALVAGEWFPITVIRASEPTQFEIMHVTARSGDVLTVTRAREGTVAITFSVGDVVEHRLTKDALDRDFVRLGPDSLESVRLSVSADGSNLKATVHADGKELEFGTAATRDVGTGPDDVPTNSDLGTAATRDVGTGPDDVPTNSDLGTAATRDVVTSTTDTTEGRLMALGTWGFGGASPRDNSVHVDDLLPGQRRIWVNQFTEADAVAAGLPALGGNPDLQRSWNVETIGIGTRAVQYASEVFGQGTYRGRTFIRVKHDATWYPWQEVYTTGNTTPGMFGLGVGQTWQDVSESRVKNTIYTNTTGRPIMVAVDIQGGSGTDAIVIDGISLSVADNTVSSPPSTTVSLIVPNGSTYKVVKDSGTFRRWAELR